MAMAIQYGLAIVIAFGQIGMQWLVGMAMPMAMPMPGHCLGLSLIALSACVMELYLSYSAPVLDLVLEPRARPQA